MKILVCLTGASLCDVGIKLLKAIENKAEVYAIISQGFKNVYEKEKNKIFEINDFKNITFFDNSFLHSSVASGSFGIDATIIAPCSINTLAKISNGICDNLITRSAAVALKERKKLILGVREMPFSSIALSQMLTLSNLGVIIAPPIIAEYCDAKNYDEMENFIVGKWLDLLGIENNLYKRWQS